MLRYATVALVAVLWLLSRIPPVANDARAREGMSITHGIASGDVTAHSAVIWARTSGPARMHVEYDPEPGFPRPKEAGLAAASEATDYTAKIKLGELAADTRYFYRVWFSRREGDGRFTAPRKLDGTFTTAPAPSTRRAVRFVFGGDLGGGRYCRHVDRGYAIFSRMKQLNPRFFIANGDMIYADHDCPAAGPKGWRNIPGDFPRVTDTAVNWMDPAQVRDVYLKHWRYNRADRSFQDFLQHTPMYVQWDDHEVINDFGASWSYWTSKTIERKGYANLVAAGRDALFHYSPIDRDPDDPTRIYRSFTWGAYLDLFILDARSYRSRNDLPDTPESGKTMLGGKQLDWLKRGLSRSKAVWKVVSSDVPLSIPTGPSAFARDGWATGTDPDVSPQTGFERELLDLMRFLDDKNVKNVVVMAADVHFPATIRYELDANGDGDMLIFHELTAGPLGASPRPEPPSKLDPALNPVLLYAEGGLFNFRYVRIEEGADGKPRFIADVRGEDGQPRRGSRLELAPQ